MNSFKIGDKVIYPNHGIAVIEDIQEENYFGENFKSYHVRLLSNNALVLVPSTNAEEMGIRKPISEEDIKDVYKFMRNSNIDVTENWKGRYKENLDLMKSGSILNVALVLKNLFYLSMIKSLSFREKKMMEKAKELIVLEISEVSSISYSKIEEKVSENLSVCFKNPNLHTET